VFFLNLVTYSKSSVDQFFTTVVEFLKFGEVESDRCRQLFLGLSGLWLVLEV